MRYDYTVSDGVSGGATWPIVRVIGRSGRSVFSDRETSFVGHDASVKYCQVYSRVIGGIYEEVRSGCVISS